MRTEVKRAIIIEVEWLYFRIRLKKLLAAVTSFKLNRSSILYNSSFCFVISTEKIRDSVKRIKQQKQNQKL